MLWWTHAIKYTAVMSKKTFMLFNGILPKYIINQKKQSVEECVKTGNRKCITCLYNHRNAQEKHSGKW